MTPSIVVLTDFFSVTNRALSYAAGLAMPLQAHLVLLHVRHDGLLSPEEYHHDQQRNPWQLTRELTQLASTQPVPAEVEVSEDFLPDAVEAVVHQHQPRLLVLGRPGTAVMPVEEITSAAMDLLRRVPYPLLTVPTVGWDTCSPHRLAVAVDGDDFTLYEGQGIVRELLQTLQATLTILHVTDKKDPGAAAGHRANASVQQSGLAPVPVGSYPHIVYNIHTVEGILQGAAELGADLLILIARRHSLLGSLFHRSVTARVISSSAIPVLVLPARD